MNAFFVIEASQSDGKSVRLSFGVTIPLALILLLARLV